jgi:hypothetical protein
MSRRKKQWIVRIRFVQLIARVLQLNGAIGLLVLMIIINNVDPLYAWVLRFTVRVSEGREQIDPVANAR